MGLPSLKKTQCLGTKFKLSHVSLPCKLCERIDLRAYPTGLGVRIHHIYQEALKLPAFPPLRFCIKIPTGKPESQIFTELPLGDVWNDADLLPVFEYIYQCKYVRTAPVQNLNFTRPIKSQPSLYTHTQAQPLALCAGFLLSGWSQ